MKEMKMESNGLERNGMERNNLEQENVKGTWGSSSLQKIKGRWDNLVYGLVIRKDPGIDGILVTVGLCIIALLLCVVMQDELTTFIGTIVGEMQTKATGILGNTP